MRSVRPAAHIGDGDAPLGALTALPMTLEADSYVPDFVARLHGAADHYLILETKGFDDLAEVKAAAADRWVKAVNADGQFGQWRYAMARSVAGVREILDAIRPDVAE